MTQLYTWGYAGRPVFDLIAYMRDLDAVCVDIRFAPYSRDRAWVREDLARAITRSAQEGTLPHNRLLYRHVSAYGNKNYKGGPIELADPRTGRRVLQNTLQFYNAILLCMCRDYAHCHRSTVAEDLIAAGIASDVTHLPSVYGTDVDALDDTHPCPITGCPRRCQTHILMCSGHWRLVPLPLQRRVYGAWRRGSPTPAYLAVREEAIAAVEDNLRQRDSVRS